MRTRATLSIRGAGGKTYTSSSYIALSWWLYDDFMSSSDHFYITEDLPASYHAMLDHMPDNANRKNKALPIYNTVQTAGK